MCGKNNRSLYCMVIYIYFCWYNNVKWKNKSMLIRTMKFPLWKSERKIWTIDMSPANRRHMILLYLPHSISYNPIYPNTHLLLPHRLLSHNRLSPPPSTFTPNLDPWTRAHTFRNWCACACVGSSLNYSYDGVDLIQQ